MTAFGHRLGTVGSSERVPTMIRIEPGGSCACNLIADIGGRHRSLRVHYSLRRMQIGPNGSCRSLIAHLSRKEQRPDQLSFGEDGLVVADGGNRIAAPSASIEKGVNGGCACVRRSWGSCEGRTLAAFETANSGHKPSGCRHDNNCRQDRTGEEQIRFRSRMHSSHKISGRFSTGVRLRSPTLGPNALRKSPRNWSFAKRRGISYKPRETGETGC